MATNDLFAPPRDLVLRLTDAEPGFYESEDGPFAVCKHEDGKCYEMIWCVQGEGKTFTEPGDLLFEDTYLKAMDVDYGDDEGVIIESIPITLVRTP